jgi:AcrR family transcriptional regulator
MQINMSPRTDKQFEAIRAERRKQIMHVALELIAKDGFSNVPISKIAAKAKISKGLMYNYFESKEQLIYDILMEGINEFHKAFDPDKDGILTDIELHFFIDQVFDVLKSNVKFWRLYFMIMLQPEVYKLIEHKIEEVMAPFMKIGLDYFTRKKHLDPETEMRFFGAIMDGISLNFVMDPTHFPLEGIKNKLHEMYK